MLHKPFFFIGNIIESNAKDALRIKPNYEIKKASPDQIKVIKTRFENIHIVSQVFPSNINSYESIITIAEDNKSYQIGKIADEKDWNYWILEINYELDEYIKFEREIRKDISIIDKAFLLSDLNIQLFWGFLHYQISEKEIYVDHIASQGYRPLNFYKESGVIIKDKTIIDKPELDNIRKIIERLETIDNNDQYRIFQKVIDDFVDYFEIPPNSPFRTIGLFAILEYALTTHDNDRSLNKQLQTKLNLVNNRFDEKIDISEFFQISDGFKFEKIIEKLYGYRSYVAHGNPIDFEKKLQVLNNSKLVEKFILKLTRKTLLQILIEPELFLDLKNAK